MAESSDAVVYLDTNFFIRAVEGTQEVAAPAKNLIEIFRRKRAGIAITSEITFAEVLAPTQRPDALRLDIKRRVYLDLLLWSKFIGLIPVSRSILIETADLRTVSSLKLPDAIHLVSAIQNRCRFFVSADRDFKNIPQNMEWLNSDERGLSDLARILS